MAGGGLVLNYEVGDTIISIDSTLLFVEGGPVHEAFSEVLEELVTGIRIRVPPARSTAPAGAGWSTGRLASAVYGDITLLDDRDIGLEAGADTPYAKFVHDGTAAQGTRYIYTTEGWAQKAAVDAWIKGGKKPGGAQPGWMMPITRVPFAYGSHGFHARVHGQRANPFVTDAYAAVARRHPMLPAKRFSRTFD